MLHAASCGIRVGFSQLMANTGASDGTQSQDNDWGLQVVWRSINEQQQSIQNLTQWLKTIQAQLQVLFSINGQERRNDQGTKNYYFGPIYRRKIGFRSAWKRFLQRKIDWRKSR